MSIKSEHIAGFALGLGVAAVGLVLYSTNRSCVHNFLNKCGICTGRGRTEEPGSMPLKELVAEKERLEDIIAEREMAAEVTESPEEPTS
jgi:hypothetical protein